MSVLFCISQTPLFYLASLRILPTAAFQAAIKFTFCFNFKMPAFWRSVARGGRRKWKKKKKKEIQKVRLKNRKRIGIRGERGKIRRERKKKIKWGKGEESKENHLTLYITDVFISLGLKHVLVKASNSSSMVVSAWFQRLSPAQLAPSVWARKPFCHRTQDRTAESRGWARIHPAICCLVGGMRVWVYPSWCSQWTPNTVLCDVNPNSKHAQILSHCDFQS